MRTVSDERLKKAYEAYEESLTTYKAAEIAGMSQSEVSVLWKKSSLIAYYKSGWNPKNLLFDSAYEGVSAGTALGFDEIIKALEDKKIRFRIGFLREQIAFLKEIRYVEEIVFDNEPQYLNKRPRIRRKT